MISPEQQALRPEVLRADALKALAEHSASTSLKRALLRKTRHQQDLHQLQPGQPIAFWRWSGRSRQHKRGAWSLARFVSVDPHGKSIWAQINTTTIKIAGNQIRTACGWESWSPTREDIAILKDAEKNLRQDLWEDAREEPPREEQEVMKDLARIPLADSEVVLPLRLPTASASTPPTPRRSQQTAVQQEQPQTNVQQGVQQTTVQQEQHQTNVQQGVQHAHVYQKYVDNRSVTMNVPLSPVPPTPRNRRGRSRTPSRRSQSLPRTPTGGHSDRRVTRTCCFYTSRTTTCRRRNACSSGPSARACLKHHRSVPGCQGHPTTLVWTSRNFTHYQSYRRQPRSPKGNKTPRTTTCATSLVNNHQKQFFFQPVQVQPETLLTPLGPHQLLPPRVDYRRKARHQAMDFLRKARCRFFP